jgi:pyruvate,orthophosphate dikinase
MLDDFDPVNRELKAVVTAWQIREVDGRQILNDHQDRDYDRTVLARLAATDVSVQEWLNRYQDAWLLNVFRRRLTRALAEVESGEHAWILSPRVDSYHSVWFELHEHLIRLSGRTRAEEAMSGRAQ